MPSLGSALSTTRSCGPSLRGRRRHARALAGAAAWRTALAVFLVGLGLAFVAAAPKFPALTGRIVDEANLLSAEDRRALEGELQALEEKSTDQLVIYTARSLQGYAIEDFGYQLGRAWQIGQKD